jgi:hypothetical protein
VVASQVVFHLLETGAFLGELSRERRPRQAKTPRRIGDAEVGGGPDRREQRAKLTVGRRRGRGEEHLAQRRLRVTIRLVGCANDGQARKLCAKNEVRMALYEARLTPE